MTEKPHASSRKAAVAASGALDDVDAFVQRDRAQTRAALAQFRAALRQSTAAFPTVVALTARERKYSNGRIAAAEVPSLRALLDVVDAHPAVFASLAARDHGVRPAVVETDPARHATEILATLVPLVDELAAAHRTAIDLALRLGELVRSVTGPAYGIAAANAPFHAALRADLAPVTDFHRQRAKGKKPRSTTPDTPRDPSGNDT